jgi:hypothetical protein
MNMFDRGHRHADVSVASNLRCSASNKQTSCQRQSLASTNRYQVFPRVKRNCQGRLANRSYPLCHRTAGALKSCFASLKASARGAFNLKSGIAFVMNQERARPLPKTIDLPYPRTRCGA